MSEYCSGKESVLLSLSEKLDVWEDWHLCLADVYRFMIWFVHGLQKKKKRCEVNSLLDTVVHIYLSSIK